MRGMVGKAPKLLAPTNVSLRVVGYMDIFSPSFLGIHVTPPVFALGEANPS